MGYASSDARSRVPGVLLHCGHQNHHCPTGLRPFLSFTKPQIAARGLKADVWNNAVKKIMFLTTYSIPELWGYNPQSSDSGKIQPPKNDSYPLDPSSNTTVCDGKLPRYRKITHSNWSLSIAILNLPKGDILKIWGSKVHQHVSVHIVATSCIDGIKCLFPFYQLLFGHI